MGPGPIPASKIERWASMLAVQDVGMFRACIRAMDGVYLDHINTPDKDQPSVSVHEMSPGLFDAVFG